MFSLRASLAGFISATAASERVVRHLHALVLGRQDSLQEADWQTLRSFGMTHAFVVSGLHLIIFFMVSTSCTDLSELVVNLPEAEGETVEPDKGLDIIITADGSMFLNGTPFPADAENLRAIIIEKTGSRRDIPVSIVADGDTRHAMVVMSMDTVSQLGFKRLSISTQRPAAGE